MNRRFRRSFPLPGTLTGVTLPAVPKPATNALPLAGLAACAMAARRTGRARAAR